MRKLANNHLIAAICGFNIIAYELAMVQVADAMFHGNTSLILIIFAFFASALAGLVSALHLRQTACWGVMASCIAVLASNVPLVNFAQAVELEFVRLLILLLTVGPVILLWSFTLSRLFVSAEAATKIYYWDLLGGAVAAVITGICMASVGPERVLLGLLASSLCVVTLQSGWPGQRRLMAIVGLLLAPFVLSPIWQLEHVIDKREAVQFREREGVEFLRWDPAAKVEVINSAQGGFKRILFNGGGQRSRIYQFDGDLAALRQKISNDPQNHFWDPSVMVPHWLMRDRGSHTLIVGGPGGQELRAALAFAAGHIDVAEQNASAIQASREHYNEFNGKIFSHPSVTVHFSEGRNFLRRARQSFDVVQIYSVHDIERAVNTLGGGAFLYTSEAFHDYFTALSENGVLHITHFAMQRLVYTAASAWRESGRHEFARHLLVLVQEGSTQPALFLRMRPWQPEEIDQIMQIYSQSIDSPPLSVLADPRYPDAGFFSASVLSGELSKEERQKIPFNINPATDDRPFFYFFWNIWATENTDVQSTWSDKNMKRWVLLGKNGQLMHFWTTGLIAVLMFILSWLLLRFVRRVSATKKPIVPLSFFALTGVGFVAIEVTLIQLSALPLGGPHRALPVVLASMLVGAGIGSRLSERGVFAVPVKLLQALVALAIFTFILPQYFHLLPIYVVYGLVICGAVLLSVVMGQYFPRGLQYIKQSGPAWAGLAFAINAGTSLCAYALTLTSWLSMGLNITLALAIGVYILSDRVWRGSSVNSCDAA